MAPFEVPGSLGRISRAGGSSVRAPGEAPGNSDRASREAGDSWVGAPGEVPGSSGRVSREAGDSWVGAPGEVPDGSGRASREAGDSWVGAPGEVPDGMRRGVGRAPDDGVESRLGLAQPTPGTLEPAAALGETAKNIPSRPDPHPTSDGSVNGLSSVCAAPSASQAMVGIRVPAPDRPRRAGSHDGLRHGPNLPVIGERAINVTAAEVEEHGWTSAILQSGPKMLEADGRAFGADRGSVTPAPDAADIEAGRDQQAAPARKCALRLGLRQVKGLKQEEMARLVARRAGGYRDLADVRRRAGVSAAVLDRLARADAFQSMTLDRRGAIWRAIGLDRTGHELDLPPLFAWAEGRTAPAEPDVALPRMTLGQEVAEDYANLRLTLRRHPLALLRRFLDRGVVKAARLAEIDDGRRVEVAGLPLVRQRPGTASGVIFITIEDESGVANLVVWPAVFERFRPVVLGAQLLVVRGKVQKEGLVIHVVADTLVDRTDLLRRLAETDHDIEAPVARADRVKPPRDSGRRRRSASPPFAVPLAHADHAKNSGPPDPRDPGHRPRREQLLAQLGKVDAPFEAPRARADEVKRNTRNIRELHPKAPGFKSRDFH
jgi:Helix-hairpin-helix motif